jgi:hypothetical protein
LRQEGKRLARAAATAAAKDQLQAIKANSSKRLCSDEKYGECGLPHVGLQQVMICLAGFEADGVRGLSMAACDLANAALVSTGCAHAHVAGAQSICMFEMCNA